MRLSVACNFDRKLITNLTSYPVEEVFGKLTEDYLGGGRSSYMLPQIKKKEFEDFVDFVQRMNISFNYLLNAPCFNNQEYTKEGQKKINRMLEWIDGLRINTVTVSSPFLLQIIKKRYPHFKVRISVFACVDSPLKVARWEDLGADCITLDSLLINRDFDSLEKIKKSSKIDLQLMVNNSCLLSCPMCHYHNSVLGHSSQSHHRNKGFVVDICILRCSYLKLKDPSNYLRSEWIRPEDLHLYEELGFDNFKIVERSTPTEIMIKRIKAYVEHSYEGNLLDIVQPYGYRISNNGQKENRKRLFSNMKYLFHPSLVNPFKFQRIKKLAEKRGMLFPITGAPPVYIENKQLDGFVDEIKKRRCRYRDCRTCQYCEKMAEKVVKINSNYKTECLSLYEGVFDSIFSGDLWNV